MSFALPAEALVAIAGVRQSINESPFLIGWIVSVYHSQ